MQKKTTHESNTYRVMGLMSGTSLDGLDIVYAEFSLLHDNWKFRIIACETISYSGKWVEKLQFRPTLKATELAQLDADYGKLLAQLCTEFLRKNNLNADETDLIASHGHTLFHCPDKGFTTQIGNGLYLNVLSGIPVINNFRYGDIVLGGQGAPLVPIGDEFLFDQYDACMNLGGFSNISFKMGDKRIAFDICPVNYVLNKFSQIAGYAYDDEGKMARAGNLHEELLKELDQLQYYRQEPPKSLGAEWVNNTTLPILDKYNLSPSEILHTYTQHISGQIAGILNNYKIETCLCTGGGVYNKFLTDLIQSKTSATLHVPESEIIEFKEALIFGFLGVLKLRQEVNILASVTGAANDHSSGEIFDKEQKLKKRFPLY